MSHKRTDLKRTARRIADWEKNMKPIEDVGKGLIYHKPGSNKKS